MNTVSINTFEDIHHLCLMYGLKKAYQRFPFLVHNIMATPPPFRRNPDRPRLFIGAKLNPVCVQYFRKDIILLYDETRVKENEIAEFAKAVVEEYLVLRHPYMKHAWEGGKLLESATGHLVAEIA